MTGVQTCALDRKSTRLNSSHTIISYAVFCLKKKRIIYTSACTTVCRHPSASAQQCTRTGDARRSESTAAASRDRGKAVSSGVLFFFNDRAPTESHALSLHAALTI